MSGERPQVVAHRGASHHEPEHTLEAYERAIRVGADALECDVRLTADGHLVCVHDRTAKRTSNGRGAISNLELAKLEGLDWGSWKARLESDDTDVDWEIADRSGSHLLTFKELLRTTLDAGRRVDLAVETKHPSKHTGRVEKELARVLAEFGLDTPDPSRCNVRVMSFSLTAVSRMTTLAPQVPLAWLMEGVVPQRIRGGQLPPGISIAAMSVGMLRRNPGLVAEQHARGHEVHVWTVDDPDDIQRCLRNGVDAIITNKPKKVLKAREAFWG
nr:glycerophosphodiester phosphodiesterase family protein [Dermacoccus nishinomiyaensis]